MPSLKVRRGIDPSTDGTRNCEVPVSLSESPAGTDGDADGDAAAEVTGDGSNPSPESVACDKRFLVEGEAKTETASVPAPARREVDTSYAAKDSKDFRSEADLPDVSVVSVVTKKTKEVKRSTTEREVSGTENADRAGKKRKSSSVLPELSSARKKAKVSPKRQADAAKRSRNISNARFKEPPGSKTKPVCTKETVFGRKRRLPAQGICIVPWLAGPATAKQKKDQSGKPSTPRNQLANTLGEISLSCPSCSCPFSTSSGADRNGYRLPVQSRECPHLMCKKCVIDSAVNTTIDNLWPHRVPCVTCGNAWAFDARNLIVSEVMCQLIRVVRGIASGQKQKIAGSDLKCSVTVEAARPSMAPASPSAANETLAVSPNAYILDSPKSQRKTRLVMANDILCTLCGKYNSHPGNVRYRELVSSRTNDFAAAKTDAMRESLARGIVEEMVAQYKGMFLKRLDNKDDEKWVVIRIEEIVKRLVSSMSYIGKIAAGNHSAPPKSRGQTKRKQIKASQDGLARKQVLRKVLPHVPFAHVVSSGDKRIPLRPVMALDVLLTPDGVHNESHPGNAHYFNILTELQDEFDSTKTYDDSLFLAHGVIHTVKEKGCGAFLKRVQTRNDEVWEEFTAGEAGRWLANVMKVRKEAKTKHSREKTKTRNSNDKGNRDGRKTIENIRVQKEQDRKLSAAEAEEKKRREAIKSDPVPLSIFLSAHEHSLLTDVGIFTSRQLTSTGNLAGKIRAHLINANNRSNENNATEDCESGSQTLADPPSSTSLEATVKQWKCIVKNLRKTVNRFGGEIGCSPELCQSRVENEQRIRGISGEMDTHLEQDLEWMAAFKKLLAHKIDRASQGKLHEWIQPACDELGPWCEEQRNMYCNPTSLVRRAQQKDQGDCSSNIFLSKVSMLRSIGFVWYPAQMPPSRASDEWKESFNDLRVSMLTRGSTFVPNTTELGLWAGQQRLKYKNGTLSDDRLMALNAIGFKWEEPAADWNNMMSKLTLFCETYGDCLVPAPSEAFQSEKEEWKQWWCDFYEEFKPFSHLWWWMQWIRSEKKRGIFSFLTPEQVGSLDSLGFIWSTDISESFVRGFRKLKSYWNEHGTSSPPSELLYGKGSKNPIAYFIHRCRVQYEAFQKKDSRSGQFGHGRGITQETIALLEEINFTWRVLPYKQGGSWDYHFEKLCKFSEANGHCMVPQAHKELGQWVKKQRQAYVLFQAGEACDFNERKIEKLESLGFVWRIRNKRGLGRQKDKLQGVQAEWRKLRAEQRSKESENAEKS